MTVMLKTWGKKLKKVTLHWVTHYYLRNLNRDRLGHGKIQRENQEFRFFKVSENPDLKKTQISKKEEEPIHEKEYAILSWSIFAHRLFLFMNHFYPFLSFLVLFWSLFSLTISFFPLGSTVFSWFAPTNVYIILSLFLHTFYHALVRAMAECIAARCRKVWKRWNYGKTEVKNKTKNRRKKMTPNYWPETMVICRFKCELLWTISDWSNRLFLKFTPLFYPILSFKRYYVYASKFI